jgi:hypothetical protein
MDLGVISDRFVESIETLKKCPQKMLQNQNLSEDVVKIFKIINNKIW